MVAADALVPCMSRPSTAMVLTMHYTDIIISAMASQITGVLIVCSSVSSGGDQRIHQRSASLAFLRGIHRWLVDSLHKGPVTWKMFPFHDVIMEWQIYYQEEGFQSFGASQCRQLIENINIFNVSSKWLIALKVFVLGIKPTLFV